MSASASACPCGLPQPYGDCCGRLHRGVAAPTAELLMRSRYSAYVVGDSAYLLATWHPSTRPVEVDTAGGWHRLEVLAARGGLLDVVGAVRFRAHHAGGVLEEDSRFVRDAGRWSYLGPAD
jgi:SEC-C motif domain protein